MAPLYTEDETRVMLHDAIKNGSETFKKNHRMSQQIFGLNRLSDLPELKERAKEVLKGLDKGEI